VNRVLELPLDHTYHVVLRSMCLASLDPLKYQQQLAQCAQWLVDNQCGNGQWSYGEPEPNLQPPGNYPTSAKGPIGEIETGPGAKAPPKQVVVKKGKAQGPATGDNSNSQYAALGIRACLSGLVVVPKETIEAAEKWWEQNQQGDGGWSYEPGDQGTWGSMTAGAVGSLAIYKYYRKRVFGEAVDWKGAPSIKKGCDWMAKKLTMTRHPHAPVGNIWFHYWVYAVERAGRILETEKFGTHEWYPEGALPYLDKQKADGSWPAEDWETAGMKNIVPKDRLMPGTVIETCYMILFLRRATPRLDETIKTGADR
jgi:hypothetical protein